MPSDDRSFIVRGQVRHADGRLLSGLRVRAYDKDLRSEELLGEAITDDEGNYEIGYTAGHFRRAEKQSADLIVRVVDRDVVLAESPLIFNGGRQSKAVSNGLLKKANGSSDSAVARTIETVNLVVEREEYRRPSEYERHITDIKPLLRDGEGRELSIAELKEEEDEHDVTFIAGETGIDRMHIVFLILGARHGHKTSLPPEAFYGMFRQGLPTNLSALLMQPSRRHREALEKSLRDNLIPSALSHDLDRILTTLPQLIGTHVLKARDTGSFVLGDLLNAGDVPVDIQEKFLRRHLEHEGPIDEFWKSLAEDSAFAKKAVIDDLQLTLHLGSLTQDNVPLVKALHGLRQRGTLHSLRDLTKLEAQDWKALIAGSANGHGPSIPLSVPGSTDEDRVANYVNDIIETLKDTFPTVYISRGLATEPELGDASLVKTMLEQNPQHDPADLVPDDFIWDGIKTTDRERAKASLAALRRELKMFPGTSIDAFSSEETVPGAKTRSGALRNPIRKEVTKFLDHASEFDLRDTHIDSYLANGGKTAFAAVTNKEAVKTQLKQLQRVFRIAPRYEHMEALITEGYHSAFSIASTPPKNFVQQMATKLGGTASAQAYYVKAQRRAAETTRAAATAYDLLNGVSTMVTRITEDQKKTMPTWAKLFGSPDLCECQHCRSVYGPAAYFVDLLQFLRKSGEQPFTVLNLRRPDLQHIKLTCENTNTTLPYVDLVNEILESYVALGKGRLDRSTAKNTVNITAEELSVNPQYTNDAAYQKLKQAVHTFQLPFNRPVEVARAYLEHVGSSRYEVMALWQRTPNLSWRNTGTSRSFHSG